MPVFTRVLGENILPPEDSVPAKLFSNFIKLLILVVNAFNSLIMSCFTADGIPAKLLN